MRGVVRRILHVLLRRTLVVFLSVLPLASGCGGRKAGDAVFDASTSSLCPAGSAPAAVASSYAVGFTLDQGVIYFAQQDASGRVVLLRSVPVAGGAPTSLASDDGGVPSIATDEARLYWLSWAPPTYAVRSVSKAGGAVQTVASSPTEPHGLAVDGTSIYVGSPSTGEILTTSKTGGTFTAMGRLPGGPVLLAQDAQNVYASGVGTWRVPKDGSGPVRLSLTYVNYAAVDQHFLYGDLQGRVIALPLVQGPEVVIGNAQNDPGPVAIDGRSVYWLDNTAHVVRRALKLDAVPDGGPIDGGATADVATGVADTSGIALDEACVYWVTGTAQNGAIVRGPK